MSTLVTQEQHDALEKMAENAAHDISGDFPDLETAYDLYIEDLDGRTYGVVNMGDAWQYVGVWENGAWEMHYEDAYEVTERILRKRGF